jgi:hypothetical protein
MSTINPVEYLIALISTASTSGGRSRTDSEQSSEEAKVPLVEALQVLAVKDLDFDHSIKLLLHLVSHCYRCKSDPEVLRLVLSAWCADDNNIDGVIADLAAMIFVPAKVLTYVCQTLSERSTLYDLLETVVQTRQGPSIGFAIIADRLIAAFNETPEIEVWNNLLEVAKVAGKTDDTDVVQYLKERIGQTRPPVKRPKWVNVLPNENRSLLQTVSGGQTPSEELLEKITSRLHQSIITSESSDDVETEDTTPAPPQPHIEDMVETYIATSVPEELETLNESSGQNTATEIIMASLPLSGLKESLNATPDVAGRAERLWGPVNAIIGRDCSSNNGPCRMLSCVCRDLDQALDEELEPQSGMNNEAWFVGKCDGCRRTIINISYALRFPVTNGGWVGCFCSWRCLQARPPRPIFAEESTAIARVKAVIEQFGIYDRTAI